MLSNDVHSNMTGWCKQTLTGNGALSICRRSEYFPICFRLKVKNMPSKHLFLSRVFCGKDIGSMWLHESFHQQLEIIVQTHSRIKVHFEATF